MPLNNSIFIVAFLFLFQCNNNQKVLQSRDLNIIALIVEDIAIPVPPPPPPSPEEIGTSLGRKTLDSLKSIKLEIVLNPVLLQFKNLGINRNVYPSDYANLIDNITSHKPKNISNISLKNISRHNLQFTEGENEDLLDRFDILISLSNIVWSKDKKRAAAVATRKLGKFNGTTYLFLFKRNLNTDEITIHKKYVLQRS